MIHIHIHWDEINDRITPTLSVSPQNQTTDEASVFRWEPVLRHAHTHRVDQHEAHPVHAADGEDRQGEGRVQREVGEGVTCTDTHLDGLYKPRIGKGT